MCDAACVTRHELIDLLETVVVKKVTSELWMPWRKTEGWLCDTQDFRLSSFCVFRFYFFLFHFLRLSAVRLCVVRCIVPSVRPFHSFVRLSFVRLLVVTVTSIPIPLLAIEHAGSCLSVCLSPISAQFADGKLNSLHTWLHQSAIGHRSIWYLLHAAIVHS